MRPLLLVIVWLLIMELAQAGERIACSTEPSNDSKEWHYRTKVPGYAPGIRDDRCWYIGAAMKPREELYWTPWALEQRWHGAKDGWEHKE